MSSTAQPLRESISFWTSLRDAIRGGQRDCTQGSISRAITLLAVPMVLEMAMESLFGIVDVFFVAHLGADAVASVGLTESLLTPLFAIALGLSMGTTAIVARRVGEKQPAGAAVAAVQAILVGIVISAVVGVTGFLFAPKLLALMGASEAIVKTGSGYTRMIFSGSATIFFLFLINAVFRGAGDATIAMRKLWLANVINIVLNPCLILGPGSVPRAGCDGIGCRERQSAAAWGLLSILASDAGRRAASTFPAADAGELGSDEALGPAFPRGHVPVCSINVSSWIALVRMAGDVRQRRYRRLHLAIRIMIFGILPSWGMATLPPRWWAESRREGTGARGATGLGRRLLQHVFHGDYWA